MAKRRKPNIVLIAVDSLRADHMSCYSYFRQTTPRIDRFAREGTLFENTYSAFIPTTSAYASMLTGMDVFSTQVVALRHQGPLRPEVKTLAEVLREAGYITTCVGFPGNPSSRGFDNYLDYAGWGSWNEGRSPKAQNLNQVALPELDRLARQKKPFFLFLRHMDPHAPYLPPEPFERMFYHGNECDPNNRSMQPVMAFKPFRDFFASWMPPGITDKDYVIAQYDGAVAYMDACIQTIFAALESRGLLDDTIVVFNSDHGETLYDHDCYFDHHGLYEPTLHVPLIIRFPGKVGAGKRVAGYNQQQDLMPTLLDLAGIETDIAFDGRSLVPMLAGQVASFESEFYITEAIQAVLARVKHVHIRDCKGRQQGPGKPEDQVNGRGDIDLVGYMRALHAGGYTGPVDLEVIGAKSYSLVQCAVIAAEARGHMQACLQACHARP